MFSILLSKYLYVCGKFVYIITVFMDLIKLYSCFFFNISIKYVTTFMYLKKFEKKLVKPP